jgi:hypothetical protein
MGALAFCDALAVGTSVELSSQRGERFVATGVDATVNGANIFAGPWIPVAAGATVAVKQAMYLVDSTGLRSTFQFPSAPVDGFSALISLVGATNPNGVALVAGAGDMVADPQNAGQFSTIGGQVTIIGVGIIYAVKYQASLLRWPEFI